MAKFKFVVPTTFAAPVTIMTPGGDEQQFKASFVYLSDKDNDEAVKLDNSALLRKIWNGWNEDMVGEDDKPLPYSEDQRELFLAHTYITNAVVAAYVRARAGIRAKN